jgi:hypothetical protein
MLFVNNYKPKQGLSEEDLKESIICFLNGNHQKVLR